MEQILMILPNVRPIQFYSILSPLPIINLLVSFISPIMGNTPGKTSISKNPYFQTFQTTSRQGNDYLLCRKSIAHPRVREQWERTVNELRKIGNDHILTPNKWSVVDKSICGNGQILQIEYDNFSVNLTELIEERSLGNKHFDQSQLWYVILTLARVGATCNSLGHKIGDVRPQNILLNKQRQIKVLSFLSFPNDIDPFMDPNPKNFFSPEQLDQLKKQYLQNMTDPVRSESFSIGLTVLSLALLHEVDHLYDHTKGEFNEQLLDKYLQNLSTHTYNSTTQNTKVNYSLTFCDTLRFLLRIRPENRLSYTSLYSQLQPYIHDIEQFKSFNLKLQVPRLPLDQKSPKKQIITLKSRHSQKKQKNQSSPNVQDKKLKESPSPYLKYSPIIQSRYFKGDERVQKNIQKYENNDFLRMIDQKLKRSRQEFPS